MNWEFWKETVLRCEVGCLVNLGMLFSVRALNGASLICLRLMVITLWSVAVLGGLLPVENPSQHIKLVL